MTVKSIKSETLVVTKEFLKSVRTARIRDDVYLGNQKKEENLSEKEKKLEAITANIVAIEKKKFALLNICDTLTKDFEKLMDKAEKKNDMVLVLERKDF